MARQEYRPSAGSKYLDMEIERAEIVLGPRKRDGLEASFVYAGAQLLGRPVSAE